MAPTELIDRLEALLGPEGCLRDPGRQARYLVDWRGLYRGRAAAVVRPRTTGEVSSVLSLCHAARVPVVPQGGNSGLVGGATPSGDGGEVVVSLERMNGVRTIDRPNYTMTVEAGCILATVQQAALDADLYFPLSLGSEGTCQIGGNLATNAGGNAVLRYGNARELLLGLEVVLADGRVWNGLQALRKSNTGQDLKQLFVGSEGTLGIITAATLRLFPAPRQVETAMVAVESLDDVIALFSSARVQLDEFLSAFELIPRIGIDMALEHVAEVRDPLAERHPYYVLVELSCSQTRLALRDLLEDWLGGTLEQGLVTDGVTAPSRRHARELWSLREACVEAQRRAGPSLKHDVSVPISEVPAFIREATEAVGRAMPGARVVAFGHVGDGNIHFNICVGDEDHAGFAEAGDRLSSLVYDVVASFGGSFSAEHGIGRSRQAPLYTFLGEVDRDLMRRIKTALDPHGLLNPGKVLSEADRMQDAAARCREPMT